MRLAAGFAAISWVAVRSFKSLQQTLRKLAPEAEALTHLEGYHNLPSLKAALESPRPTAAWQDAALESPRPTAAWQDPSFFFEELLPSIARRAADFPSHFPSGLPSLQFAEGEASNQRLVFLPRNAVASVVACMFLCALDPSAHHRPSGPHYHDHHHGSSSPHDFNRLHFAKLFQSPAGVEKLKCFLNYFYRLWELEKGSASSSSSAAAPIATPSGYMAFRRVKIDKPPFPNVLVDAATIASQARQPHQHHAASTAARVPLTSVAVHPKGSIDGSGSPEDPSPPLDALKVNFANKYLGGGVLGEGCVQEEILIMENPELLAASALFPVLRDNEAAVVTGFERYSLTKGYARSTTFWRDYRAIEGGASDVLHIKAGDTASIGAGAGAGGGAHVESMAILNRSVVAIDALPISYMVPKWAHNDPSVKNDFQLRKTVLDRELIKAYAGFSIGGAAVSLPAAMEVDRASSSGGVGGTAADVPFEASSFGRIATGRWGCGAFGGNDRVKFLIQWIAASAAGKAMDFYTFESAASSGVAATAAPGAVPWPPGSLTEELRWAVEKAAGLDSRDLYDSLVLCAARGDGVLLQGEPWRFLEKVIEGARATAAASASASAGVGSDGGKHVPATGITAMPA